MRKSGQTLIGAGLTAFAILAVSTGPALSKCIKIDPLFGMKTYMDDKYCKQSSKKVRKSTMARKRPRVMASNSRVREMQNLLANMGYNPGPADGVSGPDTKKAANAFNTAVGLPTDSSTADTLKILKRIAGK